MRAARDVALNILRGWMTDRALVRGELRLAAVHAVFLGLIERLDDEGFSVRDAPTGTEVRIDLRVDFDFWFLGMDEHSGGHGRYDNGLTLIFPFEGDVADAETILIAVVRERQV